MSSFKELVQSHPLVLLDFSAEWCQPCKMLRPILKGGNKWAIAFAY
jgi:thioredoxin 1